MKNITLELGSSRSKR